jgi:hypothetical protein
MNLWVTVKILFRRKYCHASHYPRVTLFTWWMIFWLLLTNPCGIYFITQNKSFEYFLSNCNKIEPKATLTQLSLPCKIKKKTWPDFLLLPCNSTNFLVTWYTCFNSENNSQINITTRGPWWPWNRWLEYRPRSGAQRLYLNKLCRHSLENVSCLISKL